MGQVIIRNLDDNIVGMLKNRAARHGKSLEQELREILTDTVTGDRRRFIDNLKDLHAKFECRSFPDAAALIREDRDR